MNKLPKMTQLFFLLKMLKKASITGYLRLFLAFLKGKIASQMGRLFFTNSLKIGLQKTVLIPQFLTHAACGSV
ncbi:MAG: hypothetical protein ACJAYJ_001518 [Saprospiraceae bacterium]|jgi:hypothetical protein